MRWPGKADPLPFSFSGTFTDDTDVQFFFFYLSTTRTITAQTWSFGGGTDAADQTVPAGGFFPYLSIFDSEGNLTPYESGNVDCQEFGCNADPVTGYYYDAYIQTNPLPAGSISCLLPSTIMFRSDRRCNGPQFIAA